MILIKADERLKIVFGRLIQTMGNQVEWNGIFAIAAGNLMLPGNVRSMFFQLDQKKIFSRVMEFPADFSDAENAQGNEVLSNVFNIILYAFGKWGIIPGLKVDKDYGQLIKLFRAVLEEIQVEPDFTGDYIKFYYKEELISYEDVVRYALDWAKVENGLTPDLEEEEILGLWHSVRWSKEAAEISKSTGNMERNNQKARADERIGHNFYEVDYECPSCKRGLHMVVFDEKREPLIETVEGRVFLTRAYTCNECRKFFTMRPGSLIQEGDLYSLNFNDDDKAYGDYLDLLGRTGGRFTNYKMNEFEKDRLHPDQTERKAQDVDQKDSADSENGESANSHRAKVMQNINLGSKTGESTGNEHGQPAENGIPENEMQRAERKKVEENRQQTGSGAKTNESAGTERNSTEEREQRRRTGLDSEGEQRTRSGTKGEGDQQTSSGTKGEGEQRTSSGTKGEGEQRTSSGTKGEGDQQTSSVAKGEGEQRTSSGAKGEREQRTKNGADGEEGSKVKSHKEENSGKQVKDGEKGTSRQQAKNGIGEEKRDSQSAGNRAGSSNSTEFIRRRAGECQGKSYQEVKEAAYFVEKLPERLGKKEYELSLKKLSEYEKEDIAVSLERLERKRNQTEKIEINEVIKKSRRINREDMLRLHESLQQQDFRKDNLQPFLDKIFDKVVEMDQAEIDRICPDVHDISFSSGIEAMKQIQGGMFLPELKKKTVDMLDKKLTKMKIDENAQLVRKLKKELETSVGDRKRLHFYDARTVLGAEEGEEKEFCQDATAAIAGSLNQYEYPVIICDSSYFANGKEGFLLTPDRLFYKTMFQSGCIRIMDISKLAEAGLFQKGIQIQLQNGGKKKLPPVVRNESRDDLLKILGGFLVYLQEKPDSRKITYMARSRHEVVCCYRCGHSYKGQGVCPKCGYRENQ